MQGQEKANAFVGKDGLYSLDQKGQRRPFVFGKPLLDDSARVAPSQYTGMAVLSARLPEDRVIKKKYLELVERCIGNIRMRKVDPHDSLGFLNAIVREMNDQNYPHPGFVFDLPMGRGSDFFTMLIFDVWKSLGAPVGMSLPYDGARIVNGDDVVHVENRVQDGKPKLKPVLEKMSQEQKSSMPQLCDLAQLQSELLVIAADEHYDAKETDAAITIYRNAAMVCPENAEAHWKMGRAFFKLNDVARALDECQDAMRLEPRNSQAAAWAGSALASLERYPEAIEVYEKAIAYAFDREEKSSYSLNLAWLLSYEGQTRNAIKKCTQAIQLNSKNADAYLLRSDLYYEMGMVMQGNEDRRRHQELTGGKNTQGKE